MRQQRRDPEGLLEGRQPRDTLMPSECGADSLSGSDGVPEVCRNTALSEPQGI